MVDKNIANELETIAEKIRTAFSPETAMNPLKVKQGMRLGICLVDEAGNNGYSVVKGEFNEPVTINSFHFTTTWGPVIFIAKQNKDIVHDEMKMRIIITNTIAFSVVFHGFLVNKEYWENGNGGLASSDDLDELTIYLALAILMPKKTFLENVQAEDSTLEGLAEKYGIEERRVFCRCEFLNVHKFD